MLRCWDSEAFGRPTFQNLRKEIGQMLEEAEVKEPNLHLKEYYEIVHRYLSNP